MLVVPSAQFIHQMLEVGRGKQGVRTQVLLQPFAYGVADRSAGLAIELFAVVADSAIHNEFRFIFIQLVVAEPSNRDANCFPPQADCVPFQ